MSRVYLAYYLIIIAICLMYPTLIISYFSIKSDIRILKSAKKLAELKKWALRYIKKHNFNKNIILGKITKELDYSKKLKKVSKWGLLFEIIFVVFYFVLRNPEIIRISDKMFLSGRDNIMILDGLMILCVLSTVYVLLLSVLIEKRDSIAYEQFTRLFKEENSSH